VLHAEEMRLPIIGGVMSMAEHFADEIVPETSEFDVEDYCFTSSTLLDTFSIQVQVGRYNFTRL